MTSKFKALVFDLGGVLLQWDTRRTQTLSPDQFSTIRKSAAWQDLDRGILTLEMAYEEFSKLLKVDSSTVRTSLEQIVRSITVNISLVQTIYDLKALNPDLKFYIMSNISREHFEIMQGIDLPWSMFTFSFASGIEGMIKPDSSFFQYMIKEVGVHPSQIVMIDDNADNIHAAQSLGIYGLLADNEYNKAGGTLRSLFQDAVQQGEGHINGFKSLSLGSQELRNGDP